MRNLGGFGLVLLFAPGLLGQAGRSPVASSGFGHVLSPARRSIPGLPNGGHARPTTVGPGYAYPVYGGGYGGYYGGYYGSGYADPSYSQGYSQSYGQDAYGQDQGAPSQPPPQSSMTVIYPPQQTTVIVNQSSDGTPPNISVLQGPPPGYGPPPGNGYGPPVLSRRPYGADTSNANDTPHYLIAFKDHTIYSAVAYWVDGETLHYFTTPNTHNQVSLSLVDRDLTGQLNQESGVDLKLPPPSSAK